MELWDKWAQLEPVRASRLDISLGFWSFWEEFFVPRVIEQLPLRRRGRETKDRVFPDRSDGQAVALLLASNWSRMVPSPFSAVERQQPPICAASPLTFSTARYHSVRRLPIPMPKRQRGFTTCTRRT
jgi:hypothetical protein